MIGVRVDEDRPALLADLFGCRAGSLPSSYLGLPLYHGSVSKAMWHPVLQRMERKLSLWKANYLSLRGRITLIKAAFGQSPDLLHVVVQVPHGCHTPIGEIATKFSFDGSACGNPSPTGLGGVIRDSEGSILLSYSSPAGFGSINKAELLALRTGIREASKHTPQWLLLEGNSYCIIQWASQSLNPPWNLIHIIEEVVHLSRELNVSFHQIKRSTNQDADKLAKEGVLKTDLTVFM